MRLSAEQNKFYEFQRATSKINDRSERHKMKDRIEEV